MTSNGASHFLRIQCSATQANAIGEALTMLGCQALELRKEQGQVLAYATTDEELRSWAAVLAERFPGAEAALVALHDDWKLAWTRFLEPVALTPDLTVFPHDGDPATLADLSTQGWQRDRDLLLQPAFAFGFGEHITTRLAAHWLAQVLAARKRAHVLDFGCGTGILALVAARFGAETVVGLDIEPEAIASAQANSTLNALQAQCRFSCDPLLAQSHDFDVIVANVDSRVLIAEARQLATRMSRSAAIGLTGFLAEHAPAVENAFAAEGVKLLANSGSEGWAMLSSVTLTS